MLDNMLAGFFKSKNTAKCHVPPKLSSLPPTMSAFRFHCQRAHFQTDLWKTADMPSPPDLDSLQCEWEMNWQELQPVFTMPGQLAAQDEVLNHVSYGWRLNAKQHSAVTPNPPYVHRVLLCMGEASCQNSMGVVTQDNDDDEKST